MLIIIMLHGVKLFDDFGKFLIRHTTIYHHRSTRLNQLYINWRKDVQNLFGPA